MLLGLVLSCVTAFAAPPQPTEGSGTPGGCPVERSHMVILPPGEQVLWREGLSTSEFPLATADIEMAECLLLQRVDQWNEEAAPMGADPIVASEYFRQYCVLRDREGHRILFLNAFCAAEASKVRWQQAWVEKDNGGSCYFQALFDLTTGSITDLTVNSDE